MDYRCLNANMGPLTATVPNIDELISTIQEQAHQIVTIVEVKHALYGSPHKTKIKRVYLYVGRPPVYF